MEDGIVRFFSKLGDQIGKVALRYVRPPAPRAIGADEHTWQLLNVPTKRPVGALGLAGLFRARREREDELHWLERAQERGSFSRELELWHAHALRLAGRGEEALALYTELVAFARDAVAARAALEEAKLAERLARDPERARVACERGLLLAARHLNGAEGLRAKAALERRIVRLGPASRHSGAASSRASGEERAQ